MDVEWPIWCAMTVRTTPLASCCSSAPCTFEFRAHKFPAIVCLSSSHPHHRQSKIYHPSIETHAQYTEIAMRVANLVTHLTWLVQLFQDLLQFAEVVSVKVQFAKFGVGFEPEPIILSILQCFERRFVEVLQQFHLKPSQAKNEKQSNNKYRYIIWTNQRTHVFRRRNVI